MEFKDFFHHEDDKISEAARVLDEAKKALESGQFDQEQFDEIAEDVYQIVEMDELANDLERKIAIQTAIDIFKSIIRAIPK